MTYTSLCPMSQLCRKNQRTSAGEWIFKTGVVHPSWRLKSSKFHNQGSLYHPSCPSAKQSTLTTKKWVNKIYKGSTVCLEETRLEGRRPKTSCAGSVVRESASRWTREVRSNFSKRSTFLGVCTPPKKNPSYGHESTFCFLCSLIYLLHHVFKNASLFPKLSCTQPKCD